MRLCPQAWPTVGSASYSAQMTIDKGPDPTRARTAVVEPVGAAFDVEAGLVEHVADPTGGADLFEAELGLVVDGAAEVDQRGLKVLGRLTDGALGRVGDAGHAITLSPGQVVTR